MFAIKITKLAKKYLTKIFSGGFINKVCFLLKLFTTRYSFVIEDLSNTCSSCLYVDEIRNFYAIFRLLYFCKDFTVYSRIDPASGAKIHSFFSICSGYEKWLFLEKARIGDCTCAHHLSLSTHAPSPTLESPRCYCSKTIDFKLHFPKNDTNSIVTIHKKPICSSR